ncbi:hypothetical protein GJ496_006988 [Pomphorhynchus laevis]|nr:hypothetical protein GJ496_006988 [Pomphorhynchus laevis]
MDFANSNSKMMRPLILFCAMLLLSYITAVKGLPKTVEKEDDVKHEEVTSISMENENIESSKMPDPRNEAVMTEATEVTDEVSLSVNMYGCNWHKVLILSAFITFSIVML